MRFLFLCMLMAVTVAAEKPRPTIDTRLTRAIEGAGDNAGEIRKALERAPGEHRNAVRFLVAYMPERDLKSLSASFILTNVALAYQARESMPWGRDIPEEIFFNDVLPYASINERRDDWRGDFFRRFLPLVEKTRSPGEAAQILNRDIFKILNVRYHASKRPKPDQSPYESIEANYASCTGLSVLLIDACRAVGVPARFAGTPLWSNKRGNHSWVEVWNDHEWHFTGACEYNAGGLNKTWFQGAASKAIKDDPRHAIYASSWKQTGTAFPLVWDPDIQYVAAVNVTDRYTGQSARHQLKPDETLVAIQVRSRRGGERVPTPVVVWHDSSRVKQGTTKGPDDDTNHRLEFVLLKNHDYKVTCAGHDQKTRTVSFSTGEETQRTVEIYLEAPPDTGTTTATLKRYEEWLAAREDTPYVLAQAPFANTPLDGNEAARAVRLLKQAHAAFIRRDRAEEMKERVLVHGNHKMPFHYTVYGNKPAEGRSLYISMHGGGGAPKQVNDRQWENQKTLYKPKEGVYLAPRAPTDTWNLWHQGHIDPLYDRLIENLTVFESVNPNRVYFMGYSAGGDGVYQLAPRMADRLAAAAMMAGHPNETSPLGLRNIGFSIYMGGKDGAYNRNKTAEQWKTSLADLRKADPEGYSHKVVIYPELGHWMQRRDAEALPWMAGFTRNPYPRKIVWKQDDVTHQRFYWIAVHPEERKGRSLLRAERKGQTIHLESSDISRATVLLNDAMLNLDQPITITFNGETRFEGRVSRTLAALEQSWKERPDPHAVYTARIEVTR